MRGTRWCWHPIPRLLPSGRLPLVRARGGQERPELLLALGRHQESLQFFLQESDWPLRVRVDLSQAKDALQKALALDPTLDEARLRLGHVMSLKGDEDDALKMLATVVAPMNPKFACLARMFEAEIAEARRPPAHAGRLRTSPCRVSRPVGPRRSRKSHVHARQPKPV